MIDAGPDPAPARLAVGMGTYRVDRRLRLELRGRGARQRPSVKPLSHETPRLALDAASDLRVILRTNLAMTPCMTNLTAGDTSVGSTPNRAFLYESGSYPIPARRWWSPASTAWRARCVISRSLSSRHSRTRAPISLPPSSPWTPRRHPSRGVTPQDRSRDVLQDVHLCTFGPFGPATRILTVYFCTILVSTLSPRATDRDPALKNGHAEYR